MNSIWKLNDMLIARNQSVCPTNCSCNQVRAAFFVPSSASLQRARRCSCPSHEIKGGGSVLVCVDSCACVCGWPLTSRGWSLTCWPRVSCVGKCLWCSLSPITAAATATCQGQRPDNAELQHTFAIRSLGNDVRRQLLVCQCVTTRRLLLS